MTGNLYADLAWLPEPPADCRAQIKALRDGATGEAIMRLATHALSDTQLTKVSETIGFLSDRGADLSPLTPFRLGIIGTGTLDLLLPALIGTAARHGIRLECVQPEYGQIAQEALDPDSKINRAKCDAVLIAVDYRSLPIPEAMRDRNGCVDACIGFLDMLRDGFRSNGGAPSIIQTFAPPPEALFGSLDVRVAGTLRSILAEVNRQLVARLDGTTDLILDVAGLAETVGLGSWYSPEQWNLAKLPFSATYLRLYADHVGRLLGAIRGTSRRCLILDLDNTLWGGVIGDDGLDGIQIAQGDATGEAFLEVQRTALSLRERGVVLAVSSKNTDEIARAPFRDHPEMLLRENHFAVFQANWNDKATNITAIAEELSLGLSSMVFLDDNPVERGLIRRLLPQVAVPELPDDPALYARTLCAAGYFETITFSDEDRKRADFYQDNAKRLALQNQVGGVDAYLASLNMEIAFAPFDATGRERITQLINKSNQFNLTTRRYTEADVAEAEADPTTFTLQIRLADTFGDNGMISVVIARPADPAVWEIDTWLMSCRVLGRKVEQMVLRELILQSREAGVRRLIGVYRPTGRNAMVKDHYAKLGFAPVDEAPDGASRWAIDTETEIAEAPMAVRRTGLSSVVSS
jgi:FkbH-like protein